MIQPPTDNLYKFLAIGGLIVMAFSVYIPLQYLQEYNRAATEFYSESARSHETVRNLAHEAQKLLECAINKSDGKPSVYCARLEKLQAPDALSQWRANEGVLEIRGRWIEVLRQQYVVAEIAGVVALIAGLAVSALGFWYWYFRVQRYEDAVIKSKARGATEG